MKVRLFTNFSCKPKGQGLNNFLFLSLLNKLRSLIWMHGTYWKEEEDMFVCMYADWQAHGLNS